MFRFIGRRVLIAIPLFLFVSFATFALVELAPGDVAGGLAGDSATPEQIEAIRENLGLNEPLLSRYGDWLGSAVQGDLGTSLKNGQTVVDLIEQRLPATASLAILAMAFSIVLGTIGGVLAGMRPGSRLDHLLGLSTAVGIAMPQFWLGLVLILVFGVTLGWFPVIGYTPLTQGVWPWFENLLLPAITLSLLPAAELARQLRSSLVSTMQKDYIVTARAKGLRRRAILARHAIRNASIPSVTLLGVRMAQLLGGTVIVERVFAIPGLGSLAVEAVLTRDFVVVQGVVLLTTLIVIVGNLAVDLLNGYLDPKLRQA